MPALPPLLDVQNLDLASDRLIERRRTLPERQAVQQTRQQAELLDQAHAGLVTQREALDRSEHELARDVATVAAKAKEVEDHLYSGSVKIPKELEALQEEIRLLRDKQSTLEEREMELLEEIDQTEGDMASNRSERAAQGDEGTALEASILESEAKIDGELATIAGQRADTTAGVPAPILAEYDRLRTKDRFAGRAAAPLADGSCGGCRVKLPVLEYNRMKAEPDDALLSCVHCGRLLVR